jgi:hypothetical protein
MHPVSLYRDELEERAGRVATPPEGIALVAGAAYPRFLRILIILI